MYICASKHIVSAQGLFRAFICQAAALLFLDIQLCDQPLAIDWF